MAGRTQMLTDITRGMHHAASTTAAMVAQQYIRMLDQFFDKEEDGTLVAKMVKMQIDKKHVIMVPLIALVAPKGLSLDEMKVQMSVEISEVKAKMATDLADDSSATRSSFKVNLSPRPDTILGRSNNITDIEMVFKSGEPPEGVSRFIEEYTNLIKPVTIETINGAKIVNIGKGYGPMPGDSEAPEYTRPPESSTEPAEPDPTEA